MTEKRLNGSELLTVSQIIEERLNLYGISEANCLTNEVICNPDKLTFGLFGMSKILQSDFDEIVGEYIKIFIGEFLLNDVWETGESEDIKNSKARRMVVSKAVSEATSVYRILNDEFGTKFIIDKHSMSFIAGECFEELMGMSYTYFCQREVKSFQEHIHSESGRHCVSRFVEKNTEYLKKVWTIEPNEKDCSLNFLMKRHDSMEASYAEDFSVKELWLSEDVIDVIKDYGFLTPKIDYKSVFKRFVKQGEVDVVKMLISLKGTDMYGPLRDLIESALIIVMSHYVMKEVFILNKELTLTPSFDLDGEIVIDENYMENLNSYEESVYTDNSKRWIIGVYKD